ncbi:MAG TPA: RluA family pseudouridine synthase [Candidatus Binatia bacterium]
MVQEIIVPETQRDKKIENFLTRNFPIGYVRKLFRKSGVRLNGRRAKAQDLVQPGDRVELFIPFEPETRRGASSRAEPRAFDVIFENAEVLVLNKPAGLAVHEAKSIAKDRTLLGLLESHYRGAPFKPRLVHRLDKDTSGILLVAKNLHVAQELESYFQGGKVDKEYLCLVAGRLPQNTGTIDCPLAGRDGNPVRAITHYRIDKRFGDTTLVRVTIETGRMHQIRLHFAKLGYPVVLDSRHGDFNFNKSFRKRVGLKRQFLHAARLALTFRGKRFTWAAPLPDDLQRTLHALGNERVQRSR